VIISLRQAKPIMYRKSMWPMIIKCQEYSRLFSLWWM